jgi:hypothetical protein
VVPGVSKGVLTCGTRCGKVLTCGARCGKESVNLWYQVWQREC